MSAYAGSLFLHDIAIDPSLRALARVAPERALGRYELTEREVDLFLRGEVGALYELGVNDFLLHNVQRFGLFEVDMATYSERMRAAQPPIAQDGSPDVVVGATRKLDID